MKNKALIDQLLGFLGTMLVENPEQLFYAFPKFNPKSTEGSDFAIFYMSKEVAPDRSKTIHRLLIEKSMLIFLDNQKVTMRRGALLLVKRNKREGIDFEVIPVKNSPETYTMPIRKINIEQIGVDFKITGYCNERPPRVVANFSPYGLN